MTQPRVRFPSPQLSRQNGFGSLERSFSDRCYPSLLQERYLAFSQSAFKHRRSESSMRPLSGSQTAYTSPHTRFRVQFSQRRRCRALLPVKRKQRNTRQEHGNALTLNQMNGCIQPEALKVSLGTPEAMILDGDSKKTGEDFKRLYYL